MVNTCPALQVVNICPADARKALLGMFATGPPGLDPILPLGAFCGMTARMGLTACVNTGPGFGLRRGAPGPEAVRPRGGGTIRDRTGPCSG